MMLYHLGSAPTANKCPFPGLFSARFFFTLVSSLLMMPPHTVPPCCLVFLTQEGSEVLCRENLCVG